MVSQIHFCQSIPRKQAGSLVPCALWCATQAQQRPWRGQSLGQGQSMWLCGQGMVLFLSCTIFRAKIQLFLQMCNFFCIFVAKTMIYGYIRVSSDKQTVENQRFEIERFCKVNNLHIDGWIEETISGTKAYNKRSTRWTLLLQTVRRNITFNLHTG